MGDALKDGLTLILSSNLGCNLGKREPTASSRKNSAGFALILTYDERMFQYLPQGRTKVVRRPFKVLALRP
jgi:hypothetical protein